MKWLIITALAAMIFEIGAAFDGPAARRHAAAHHKYRRQSSSIASASSQQSSETLDSSAGYSQQKPSTSCVRPTVTVTVGIGSTILTTTTITSKQTQISQVPTPTSHGSDQQNFVASTNSTAISISPSLCSTSVSIVLSSTLSTSSGQKTACSTEIQTKQDMPAYYGFNMVNQKPHPVNTTSAGFKAAEDWAIAFKVLKSTFPKINAVRMYSTMDPTENDNWPHLENALEALDTSGIDLKILAGVWSDNYNTAGRFSAELDALDKAISRHGCDKVFAVSVGNEDLERVKLLGAEVQTQMVERLVYEMEQVRGMLRNHSCCTPVTHTDTYNEIRITSNPWVAKLLSNVDQAVNANIFPFWENVTVANSWEVWLGETGWPYADLGQHNQYGTDEQMAAKYFQQFGCQILAGNGTAFYYVDWDEDMIYSSTNPAWGLFNSMGELKTPSVSCDGYKPDMRTPTELPRWLGGEM